MIFFSLTRASRCSAGRRGGPGRGNRHPGSSLRRADGPRKVPSTVCQAEATARRAARMRPRRFRGETHQLEITAQIYQVVAPRTRKIKGLRAPGRNDRIAQTPLAELPR